MRPLAYSKATTPKILAVQLLLIQIQIMNYRRIVHLLIIVQEILGGHCIWKPTAFTKNHKIAFFKTIRLLMEAQYTLLLCLK
jgi:hypothetical protein